MAFANYLKKIVWFILVPIFPIFRFLSLKLGFSPFQDRQEFHLGYLAPGCSTEDFHDFLKKKNFDVDPIAWLDKGEILSLRLKDGFQYQYHLRLFEDRELRGHHELTPEYSPLGHLWDLNTTIHKEEFKELLGDWLVEK